ncbi:hypothetical protein H4217_007645, partial [Coemansia sp. RSA 1939]
GITVRHLKMEPRTWDQSSIKGCLLISTTRIWLVAAARLDWQPKIQEGGVIVAAIDFTGDREEVAEGTDTGTLTDSYNFYALL